MKLNKILILPIICILLLLSFHIWLVNDYNKMGEEIKAQQRVIDSLQSENFTNCIQIQRYEIIYDMLDSVCKVDYDSITNFTE